MNRKFFFLLAICFLAVSTLFSDPPDWQPITGTEYSMVVLADILLYDEPFTGSDSSNIAAAFGPGGESDCRSLGVWQPDYPPYWDGYWYFTIVGNTNGEAIHFKIYDSVSDTIYNCNEVLIFQDGQTYGSPEDPFLITAEMGSIAGNVTMLTNTPPSGNIQDVEISAGAMATNPDGEGNYQLMLSPGIYNIVATLSGYTTIILYDIIVEGNQTTDNVDFTLIDWQQITGTQYSMVVMASVDVNGSELLGMCNNIVAAFGPGGNDDCRAIGMWEEQNPPYWDGYWYLNILGDVNGEEITFRIFDEETSTIYDCIQTIDFQNNETIGSPDTPFQLTVGYEQVFQLSENWNWISFNIHTENSSLDSVFYQLGANIYQIKNQTQSATYYDPPGTWVGNLTEIVDGSAYLIFMNNAVDSFSVSGIPIESFTPISLSQNWNWIAYYPQEILSIEDALQSITSNVFQVKNQTQSASYYDPPGTWVGNLTHMEPNIGYKVMMNDPDVLIYPAGSENMYQNKVKARTNPPDWQIIPGTQYSMILMARITYNASYFEGGVNQNVAGAFGPDGESDCRSLALWQPANPPYWTDGFWYFTIVGNDNGETISFKIYNEDTDSIYCCLETILFEDGSTIGEPSNPYDLTAVPIGVNSHNVSQLGFSVYPNPFDKFITFDFSAVHEQVRDLLIYDIKGRLIRKFTDNDFNSSNILIWSGTDLNGASIPSGIYFYKVEISGLNSVGKIIYFQ